MQEAVEFAKQKEAILAEKYERRAKEVAQIASDIEKALSIVEQLSKTISR